MLRKRAILAASAAVALFLVFFPWPGQLWSLGTSGPGNFNWGLIWAAPNSRVITYMLDGDSPLYSEYHWHGLQLLAGNAFVLAGLAMLVVLATVALRLHLRARAGHPTPASADAYPPASPNAQTGAQ
jgi:hypothetical protein